MYIDPPDCATYENLYIHVPFCSGKCDYCAFYSEGVDHSSMESYTEKILAQLDQYGASLSRISTVYMGGGTPTVLRRDLLEKLFCRIGKLSPVLREFSVECNPESLDPEKAALLGDHVTRVSVGVQSFHPHLRARIGRRGDLSRIGKAFELLRKNSLDNLNCDLIYALPGETPEEFQKDLEQALALGIRHLSAYSLIVEGSSVLQKRFDPGETALSDHAALLEEQVLRPFMESTDLRRYEVSNYAAEGFICSHNDNIWHGESYLGLGPAACSFDKKDRYTNPSSVNAFLAGEKAECDHIERSSRLGEIFIMGLRTIRGWAPGEFERMTGSAAIPGSFQDHIAGLRKARLMKETALALTEKGLDYWNDTAELFI